MRFLPRGLMVHVAFLHLTNASMVVQPAGLRKFRETGQKNVHAFVRGTFAGSAPELAGTPRDWELEGFGYAQAYYNPATCDSFVNKHTGLPVEATVSTAILTRTKVYYRV